ncbi:hypothetical protein TH66_17420 [Carbonactinospora thermoautotrophica]|uniref:DUF4232 domain-containing protein n=1 Tax=Carbonactinospora thermoautotrophica TaxID=1469144 RepID=A0A132MLR6_9ACTN|nr:hypothetical protein [Carbonactinospora thermoautotrophica]KWW97437.1 hypothetical protein TH66_17420 [Carbonactinospora thermoautotrophica]KWW98689.1 hypothetical protein LI90_317 [Carbonactinospora thermoautotrophica]
MTDRSEPGTPFDPDELRRRLNEAVGGIAPAPDALERLRRGVPRRRRMRRAAAAGTGLCVLTLGALGVLNTGLLDKSRESIVRLADPAGSQQGRGIPRGGEIHGDTSQYPGHHQAASPRPGTARPGTPGTLPPLAHPAPSATLVPSVPAPDVTATPVQPQPCTSGELLDTGAGEVKPQPDGKSGVGFFEYRNSGQQPCSVGGARGPAKVTVVDPTSGGEVPFQPGGSTGGPQGMADVPQDRLVVVPPGGEVRFQFGWTAATDQSGAPERCTQPQTEKTQATSWTVQVRLSPGDPTISSRDVSPMCQGTLYVSGFYLKDQQQNTG